MAAFLGAALTAAGALLALFATGEHLNSAGHNYAYYFITRNVCVAALLLGALVRRDRRVLTGLMVLTAFIQSLDAVTAIATHRYGLVPIDLIFATVFALAAAKLWNHGMWQAKPTDEVPVGRSVMQ